MTESVNKVEGHTSNPLLEMCYNAVAFLINEIKYEIGGVIVDQTKSIDITTCIRNFISLFTLNEEIRMMNVCWLSLGKKVRFRSFLFVFH